MKYPYHMLPCPLSHEQLSSLNQNFRDIGADIEGLDQRETQSNKIESEAFDKTNALQEQLNTLVLEGNSSGEVEQARASDVYNRIFGVLKDRHEFAEQDLMDRGVNPRMFGLVGDGETDDTIALQSAIDFASQSGVGKVELPGARIKISNVIDIPSDIAIEGRGQRTVIIADELGIVFRAQGSLGRMIPLAENVTKADRTIQTTAEHGLQRNDLAYIVSQRDCLSDDAGQLWRLGNATPAAQGLYFAEFLRIKEVISETAVESATGLIFPVYRKDNSAETSSNAREYSTIQKVNAVKNVVLKNFSVTTTRASRVISFVFAYNCRAENIIYKTKNDGNFISIDRSFSTFAEKCRVFYDPEIQWVEHHMRNPYKLISAQSCGFHQCYGENATQTFDLTYMSRQGEQGYGPTVNGFVHDCETKSADYTGATTHGGTYECSITKNRFLECNGDGVYLYEQGEQL